MNGPVGFLEAFEDRLVILDEIHRAPETFAPLRSLIDRGRRRGKKSGRLLLLGSASMTLLKQSSETLAGRIAFLEMPALLATEVATSAQDIDRIWLRGEICYAPICSAKSRSSRRVRRR